MTTILHTHNLSIGYTANSTRRVVAADIEASLHEGELVCLLGPNGVGKSTLLRTLAGMQKPLAGEVWLGTEKLTALTPQEVAKRLSVVLTEQIEVGLLLSAYALVALGRYPYTDWMGRLTPADEVVVQWALEAVGAAELAARPVSQLSDGERQKVMIARALAQEPQLLVLDEPTAFLDLPRRVEIMSILRQLARQEKRAVLLSTHDLDLALRLADKIWLLGREGDLHVGAPEDLVLSGAFAHAFHSEGVQFDMLTGSFKIQRPPQGGIDVVGEGLTAVWTTRALERAGFAVHQGANGSAMRVTATADHWQLRHAHHTTEHTSIAALLHQLQEQE